MLASNSRDFCAIITNIRIRNVAADTCDLYGANNGCCGALWHPSVSKKGHFFSQAPGFYFLAILKILLPTQPYERSFFQAKMVDLCTHIRAIFAPHSKAPLPAVRKGYTMAQNGHISYITRDALGVPNTSQPGNTISSGPFVGSPTHRNMGGCVVGSDPQMGGWAT